MESNIIFTTVFPVSGIFTSLFLFLSPFKAVRDAVYLQSSGEINILPFAFLFINGISWILYSFQTKNMYVFVANIPSIPLSLYYYFSILCLLPKSKNFMKHLSMNIIMWGLSIALSISAACVLLDLDASTRKLSTGIFGTIVIVIFYTSPLYTLSIILRTKNSASIHFGLALTSLVNAFLWSIYGFCVQDYFVMGPNVVGVVLPIIQIILRLTFPSKMIVEKVELESEGNGVTTPTGTIAMIHR